MPQTSMTGMSPKQALCLRRQMARLSAANLAEKAAIPMMAQQDLFRLSQHFLAFPREYSTNKTLGA